MTETPAPQPPAPPPPPPPPPSLPPTPAYPVTVDYNPPEKIARWRPLVHWLLVIPHLIVVLILMVVATVTVVLSWFVGVVAGRIPEGLQKPAVLTLRYYLRLNIYSYWLREEYPPFSFDASFADPGDYSGVRTDVEAAIEGRNRLTILFRLILMIPHYIVLSILGYAVAVVIIIGFFAVIILGRWPEGLGKFVIGYTRWYQRFMAYVMLLTDQYPPFSFD